MRSRSWRPAAARAWKDPAGLAAEAKAASTGMPVLDADALARAANYYTGSAYPGYPAPSSAEFVNLRRFPRTVEAVQDVVAAEDLLELIMRRYERASTMLTSNRPVDEWGKLLGDTAGVTALLDRLLHHAGSGNMKRTP